MMVPSRAASASVHFCMHVSAAPVVLSRQPQAPLVAPVVLCCGLARAQLLEGLLQVEIMASTSWLVPVTP